MAKLRRTIELLCLLSGGALVCSAQPGRCTLVEIADYYADSYRVPRALVHSLIEVESNWEPYVVSGKGAVGLMQLMPATAATFGITNRFDIEQNIRAGVGYVAHLLTTFQGDVRLVAAAYYAGEGRIRRFGLAFSNADVQRYVTKLMSVYRAKALQARLILSLPPGGNLDP